IALAEAVVSDFGVAAFCGLGHPPVSGGYEAQRREMGLQAIKSTSEGQAPTHPGLRRATPETIDDVLDLHRRVAELESGQGRSNSYCFSNPVLQSSEPGATE